MNLKKLGKALLFPHITIMIILIPISTILLIYSMLVLGTESFVAILSYVFSFYTLTVWCFKIPHLITIFKEFKNENKYAKIWKDDIRFRIKITLYGTFVWNTAYAVFNLGLGFWHRTFWFLSLAGYYTALAVMRLFLIRYTNRHALGERINEELQKYRTCGIALLIMNLTLAIIIFFMVYWNRTFKHHEITTITMAAYTFVALTMAIINVFKYRKLGSPVYSASKAISLAAACVSMLTLESTMLTTFGDGTMELSERKIMLGVSGGVISLFIIITAISMIVQATKKLKLLSVAEEFYG